MKGTNSKIHLEMGFPDGTSGKDPACQIQETLETWVQSLGWEDPLEEGMATHFWYS